MGLGAAPRHGVAKLEHNAGRGFPTPQEVGQPVLLVGKPHRRLLLRGQKSEPLLEVAELRDNRPLMDLMDLYIGAAHRGTGTVGSGVPSLPHSKRRARIDT